MDQNVIEVQTSYNKNNQGIVVTFTIPVDYDQVTNIVNVSTMLSQFVLGNFSKLFKKHNFCAKYSSPMIVGQDQRLRLYMCFVANPTQELQMQLKNLGIKEVNYV